jgi:alpha-tubulin suppressor-like RCC1 family protein
MIPVTMPGVTDAVDVVLGGYQTTCVLRSGGGVRCTGQGTEGQLGNGGVASTSTLTDVLNESGTAPLTGVTSLSAGSSQICAVVSGHVLCWGTLYSQDIYDSNWNVIGVEGYSSTLPVELPGGPTDAVAVAVSDGSGCALRQTGNVVCWGSQSDGQLGNGVVENSAITTPVTVMDATGTGALANVKSVRAGEIHFCAVRNDGSQV